MFEYGFDKLEIVYVRFDSSVIINNIEKQKQTSIPWSHTMIHNSDVSKERIIRFFNIFRPEYFNDIFFYDVFANFNMKITITFGYVE